MIHKVLHSLIVVGMVLGIAAPVDAQQVVPAAPAPEAPAGPAAVSATAPPATTAAPKPPDHVPSADVLRKARMAGYYTKNSLHNVLFCKKETVIGSRFTEEHCMDESLLELTLLGQQAQRDALGHLKGAHTDYH